MTYQTTYPSDPVVAFVGSVADNAPATILSREVETAAIGFGLPVDQGTADGGIVATSGSTTAIAGVTVRVQGLDANTPNAIPVGSSASVLTSGAIWVTAGEAVTAGSPVLVTVADGTFKQTVAAGNVAIPNAVYETSGGNGDVVRIRLK